MMTSWFKFQLVSSNGVGCSESAYIHIHTHTYIHTYIVTVRKLRDLYFTTMFSYRYIVSV